jgi:hypothetical protein
MEVKYIKKDSSKGLSFLAGINRNVNPSQVTKLANAIDKMGIIRPVVTTNITFLDGKSTKYIIDGQHLYTACLRLNVDIPYTEIVVDNIQDLVEKIAMLNSSSKSWTLSDYLQSWKIINKDYIILESMFQRYDIELSQLAQILHLGYTTPSNGGGQISNVLKKGSFTVKNLVQSKILLDRITDALKLVPRYDRLSNKTFISAYSLFASHPGYNHELTKSFLIKNKELFNLSTQDPEEFNRLFNQIQ